MYGHSNIQGKVAFFLCLRVHSFYLKNCSVTSLSRKKWPYIAGSCSSQGKKYLDYLFSMALGYQPYIGGWLLNAVTTHRRDYCICP